MEEGKSETLERLKLVANQHRVDERNCKICGSKSLEVFSLPKSKLTGQPIPAEPDDCPYYECTVCHFLFSVIHDNVEHSSIYDDHYWDNQDPDWGGRVNQTLRLVWLANRFQTMAPWQARILDFGCGMGTFVESGRHQVQLQTWGTDIIKPKFGLEWYLPALQNERFDIIVACEVLEHLPDPLGKLRELRDHLNPGGVLAFQTAHYDRAACKRDWWYLGPANGHISLYSSEAFTVMSELLGVHEKATWNGYPGIQAWRF